MEKQKYEISIFHLVSFRGNDGSFKLSHFHVIECECDCVKCLCLGLGGITYYKFPLTPMGVLAPVSAHAGPSAQPPIDVSGNFPVHVSAELPSKIFPNPSEVISEVSELHNKSF